MKNHVVTTAEEVTFLKGCNMNVALRLEGELYGAAALRVRHDDEDAGVRIGRQLFADALLRRPHPNSPVPGA